MKRFVFAVLMGAALLFPARAQQTKTWFYVATAVSPSGFESQFSNEVSATVSGAHPTVDLSWVASTTPGVIGYNVYRSNVSGSGYVKLNASPVTVLTYSDTTAFPSAPTMNPPTVP